jgi:5'-nucleotidase
MGAPGQKVEDEARRSEIEGRQKVHILLTNDDGIYAPGLRALRHELMKLGEVVVVAPATEQSAVGHSITLLRPLLVQEVHDDDKRLIGWAVEGRPADCVKLALVELLPWTPDIVVSGLNAGSNAGINVLYSGTVAAAIEGAFYRRTSIAVSLEYTKPKLDFPPAAALARQVIEQIVGHEPADGSLFNVNIPSLEKGPVRGIRTMPQAVIPYVEEFDRRTDPRGRVYFWTSPSLRTREPHPDSDVFALNEGYITVTPLHFDLTHRALLKQMCDWKWNLTEVKA